MTETKIKSRNAIKGILFDFDGTLTQPGALDFPAIKQEMDCPKETPILEFIEMQAPDSRARLNKILETKEEQAAAESTPNRGAEELLLALLHRGIPMGIITRNSLISVSRSLEKFDDIKMKDFTAIITRENALPKPHPDGVYKAAGQMGLPASELMVVGDFRFDVMAGNAAGTYTVLLTNGGKSVMAPGDPVPDHVVNSLGEILEIISF